MKATLARPATTTYVLISDPEKPMRALADKQLAAAKAEAILLRTDRNGIATLTLNRPDARNALSRALMAALQAALEVPREAAPATSGGAWDLPGHRDGPQVDRSDIQLARLAATIHGSPDVDELVGVRIDGSIPLAVTPDRSRHERGRHSRGDGSGHACRCLVGP